MASQSGMEKMEMRQQYRNIWHTDLMSATGSDPLFCCFSFWCGPCASYMLRKRALYNDMTRYKCCGGYMPCSGKCGENKCPELCLCTEVLCCFGNSVSSTRFMIQDEFNIQTTKCDNCIIGFMLCLQQLACICSLVACILGSEDIEEASQALNCLADMVYCSVCPCMQTQHKVELDKRDGKFGSAPVMAVPQVQQMSRMNPPPPSPQVGFAPPSANVYPPPSHGQAYPPHGYPPYPQAQAYPPANYPPPGYPPYQQAQGCPPPNNPPPGHPPYQQAQGYTPANYPPPGYPN